jgi:AcrR family transcriptional regulator
VPRATLSTIEIESFRAQIVRAATHLFGEQGFEAVTMRSLAAHVGCSPMTPYRYFRGKGEIFALVRADAFRRFADAEEEAVAAHPDPGERLRALARTYVRFALENPEAYRIMFELRQDSDHDHPELLAQGERAWRPLHDTVVAVIDSGRLAGEPDVVAHLFWAQVHGLVALELAGKLQFGRSAAELVEALCASQDGIAGMPTVAVSHRRTDKGV